MDNHLFRSSPRSSSGDVLKEFMLLNGRYSNFTKETFFIRYASGQNWEADAAQLQAWAGQDSASGRVFTASLDPCLAAPQVEKYAQLYHGGQVRFPFHFANSIWQSALESGFDQIVELFQRASGRHEATITRNFSVKILCWMDTYFPRLFVETWKMNRFPKFSCGGRVKLTEYLFLYLLFLLGCDVLYISPTGETAVESRELLALSTLIEAPRSPSPAPRPPRITAASISQPRRSGGSPPTTPPAFSRPPAPRPGSPSTARPAAAAPQDHPSQPLEFEELSKLAASVVMLQVFDQSGQCFKSGSGVIISDKGYVLTNLHVVNGGRRYGILLEDEPNIFYTDELIKYHQDYDLAILRMEKCRPPIPIYRRSKMLARGQKVVAIGSPLGLFNSVSDGIISGFRELEHVSMIQFTAPVSHGSSGGALLNMYGELIGLTTGGYDDGQNLNLAVGYQTILQFAGGLI